MKPGSTPLVSVIIPSYNQARYLDGAIRSVLRQSYPALEVIVIDGASSDASVDVIKAHDERLAYWVSEPDLGQADAINKGLSRARGDVLGWLNSDDMLLPGAIRTIVDSLKSGRRSIVCGLRVAVDRNGAILWRDVHPQPTVRSLRRNCYINQETVYWNREVYEAVGPLDTHYRYALDYDYWQRILDAGYRFSLIPRFVGAFRIHDESKGATQAHVREQELREIYRQYLGVSVTEEDAWADIDITWRARFQAARFAKHLRLLDHPRLAGWILGTESPSEG